MNFFRTYASSFIDISDQEWDMISSFYTLKQYKKGEHIVNAGKVCDKSYYLSSGVARSYGIDSKGKEFTWMLHINIKEETSHPFLGDYISHITQEESDIFCDAVTDCKIYIADYTKIESLYKSDFKWMTLGKKVAESNLVAMVNYRKMIRRLDAKERYKAIQSFAPLYENFLTDYQFASLLNITPQSFSRIKKEIKIQESKNKYDRLL